MEAGPNIIEEDWYCINSKTTIRRHYYLLVPPSLFCCCLTREHFASPPFSPDAPRPAAAPVPVPKIIRFCSSPKLWGDGKRKGDIEMIWWHRYVQMKMASAPNMGGFRT